MNKFIFKKGKVIGSVIMGAIIGDAAIRGLNWFTGETEQKQKENLELRKDVKVIKLELQDFRTKCEKTAKYVAIIGGVCCAIKLVTEYYSP